MADALKAILVAAFPNVEIRHFGVESDFRSGFNVIAENPPFLFLVDVMFPWTRPSAEMPSIPNDVVHGGVYRAGFRCLHQVSEDARTSQVPALVHSVLALQDVAEEMAAFPHAHYLQADVDDGSLERFLAQIRRPLSPESPYSKAVRSFCQTLANQIAVNPNFLDQIEWRDLERVLAEIFGTLGFQAILTRPAKDGGKDIVLERKDGGEPGVIYVEIKHWPSAKVGRRPVREFIQVIMKDRVSGLFLSSSGYTESAYGALAVVERVPLTLGGREQIHRLCQTYTLAQSGLWSPTGALLTEILESRN